MNRLPTEIFVEICRYFCQHCCSPPQRHLPTLHDKQCVRPRGCKELCALSLTCRELRGIAQPILFHRAADLDVKTSRKFAKALKLRPDLQRHVHQYTLHVMQNKFGPDDDWNVFADHLPTKRVYSALEAIVQSPSSEASLDRKEKVLYHIKSMMNFGIRIMNMLPQLEDLYIMPLGFWYPELWDLSDSLVQLCSAVGFRNAKRVHVHMQTRYCERAGYDAVNTIVSHLHQATYLRLRAAESLTGTTIQPSTMSSTFANLTTLQLIKWRVCFDEDIVGYDDPTLREILRLCPKLESFKISLDTQNYYVSLDILEYVQVCKDTLQELDFSILDPPDDAEKYHEMESLLARLTKLRRLRLDIVHLRPEKELLIVVDAIVPRVPSTVSTLEFEFFVDCADRSSFTIYWKTAIDLTARICLRAGPNIKRMALLAQIDKREGHPGGHLRGDLQYMRGWGHRSRCLPKPRAIDDGLRTYSEGWRI